MSVTDEVSVDCYRHPREFSPGVAQLMAQADARAVESGGRWFELLVDHALTPEQQPLFYTLRRGDRVLAVLPLLRVPAGDKGSGRFRLESLSNFYTSLYEPIFPDGPLPSPQDLARLLRQVRKEQRGIRNWQLGPMDPHAPSYALLVAALRAAGFACLPYFRFGNQFMKAKPWAEYWASQRQRITIDRKRRQLATHGGRVAIITPDSPNLEEGIAAYQAVYASSWKVPEPFPAFVPGLIRLAAQAGWLRLGVAWSAEKPIAAQIWFVNGGKASIFKLAYDEADRKLSGGSILSSALMQHVLEVDGVAEVDYLIGDDPYKRDWVDQRRERWGLLAFDLRTLAGLTGLSAEWGKRAARRVQRRLQQALSKWNSRHGSNDE